jgi:DNA-binding NarL/FixJ family response regulator
MDRIKIVLVDDHKMFRDGIKSILDDQDNIQVIGEVGNGEELFELLKDRTPDIVVTDISMPGTSGIDITRTLVEKFPGIRILILSMHKNEEFITNALTAGADGYLPKDTSISELLEAIDIISRGQTYFNRDISDTILKSLINRSKTKKENAEHVSLTPRELEIINLVVDGLSNKEIAEELFISIRTVDSHKNNIMHKLNLKSTVDLVKYAIRNNLARLD